MNILITGASRGLGLAMTAQLLQHGHTVVAVTRSASDALVPLADAHPQTLLRLTADVAVEAQVEVALAEVQHQLGHLDVVINNAAAKAERPAKPLEASDLSCYAPAFQVNTVGPLAVVKHALPLMRPGGAKRIINISSSLGSIAGHDLDRIFDYRLSKAALNMASRMLHNYLKNDGFTVLALHPGWFSSDRGGPDAPITPDQSAALLLPLMLEHQPTDEQIFLDLHGKPLPW